MPNVRHRLTANRSLGIIVAVAAATAAACSATGATAIPTQPAIATSAPSGAGAASGPTTYATTSFGAPFSLTLPAGWKVVDDSPDMFTAYIAPDPTSMDAAIDIQLVPVVHKDLCNKDAGDVTGGTTAADLAAWMLALAPLAATAGTATTIDGAPALVVDESFTGTPCVNGELWPTAGGWLDASEQKRYFVFEVGGKRLVATIASSDAKFAAQSAAALAVLESVNFTP